jgi:hypothetical protein
LENEHVERALQQLNAILIAFSFWFHGVGNLQSWL